MGYLPYQLVNRISEPSTVSITEWFSPYYPATWKLHPMGHVILRHRRLGPSHSGRGRWGIAWVFLDDRNPFPLSSQKKHFSFSWDSGNPAYDLYLHTYIYIYIYIHITCITSIQRISLDALYVWVPQVDQVVVQGSPFLVHHRSE